MSETTAVKTRRVGPPCVACARPLPISDVPKSAEALEKLAARHAKLTARLAKAAGVTTVEVAPKTAE